MVVDERILRLVIERILSVPGVRRIILFGSAALGTMTPDSDLDLVVLEPDVTDARKEAARLRAAVGHVGNPVDVFAMAEARFEETKGIIGGLAFPANKHRRVV